VATKEEVDDGHVNAIDVCTIAQAATERASADRIVWILVVVRR